MAGTAAVAPLIQQNARGVVRVSVPLTCNASGAMDAVVLGAGRLFGRLVGCAVQLGTLDKGLSVITISDEETGTALLTLDGYKLLPLMGTKFASTTTGDTTGGASEDLFTTGAAHGLTPGSAIVFSAHAGDDGTGIVLGTTYYVTLSASLTATTFQLSDTPAHSAAGTRVEIGATDMTSASWFNVAALNQAPLFGSTTTGDTTGGTAEDLWTTGAAHGLVAGDGIVFTKVAGTGATGPKLGVTYYVTKTTGLAATTFCLSSTPALSAATTNDVNVGTTDATSALWYKASDSAGVGGAALFRPTTAIVDTAGTAVTAADTAANVNRGIIVPGTFRVAVTAGGVSTTGRLVLLIDRTGLGELALTV